MMEEEKKSVTSRVIKIVVFAVIVLIAYFWVTAIMESNKRTNTPKEQVIPETADTIVQEDTLVADDTLGWISDQELFGEENLSTTPSEVTSQIGEGNQESKKQEKQATVSEINPVKESQKKKEKPKEENNKTSTKNQKNTEEKTPKSTEKLSPEKKSSSVGYVVVAGSYLEEKNAQSQIAKLKGLGYTKARIVKSSTSGYLTVIAGDYNNEEEARKAATVLKAKNVDCFVRKSS